jgi:hypothetical protein
VRRGESFETPDSNLGENGNISPFKSCLSAGEYFLQMHVRAEEEKWLFILKKMANIVCFSIPNYIFTVSKITFPNRTYNMTLSTLIF